jgi:hypothetical protein
MKTLARDVDTAEIVDRLRALRHDSPRRWGRRSAHQMVCHLSVGYRLRIGERSTHPASTPLPRFMMRWIALYLPVRWPAGIHTTPDLDQDCDGTRPAAFDADLTDLETLVKRVATERRDRAGHLHPIFGEMSESAWLRWAYLHADHHLRQFGL